jgi:hypothetical protein
MSMLRRIAFCAAVVVATSALAQTPQFGQSIAPADIAPWDISIGPDGAGLPPGRGTAAQGESVYATQCQGCHGEKGAGGPNDALVGGIGSLVPDKGSHFENRRRPRQWQASARWHIAEKFSIAVPSAAGGRGRGQCAPPTPGFDPIRNSRPRAAIATAPRARSFG